MQYWAFLFAQDQTITDYGLIQKIIFKYILNSINLTGFQTCTLALSQKAFLFPSRICQIISGNEGLR